MKSRVTLARSSPACDPLRLVLLTQLLSSAAGGLAVSVPGLAQALQHAQDFDVRVFGLRDLERPSDATHWGPNVHVLTPRGPRRACFSEGLTPALQDLSPHLIDAQGLWTYPSLANLRYCRRTGTPYVVTPRGMLDPWALRHSSRRKQVARFLFEDAHLAGAACLRATSELEAVHIRALGFRGPVAIIPNGVEVPPELDTERRADGVRRLLFLSRIHPKKGLPHLLHAWASLQDRHPAWELVIAGIDERGHEAEMQALGQRLALKRLRFVGPVHGALREALYRSADLFVLPTHGENFGLVVAEALARGVPVVTTRAAPWRGLQDHLCGWWVSPERAALTTALDAGLSTSAPALQAMGRRGRAWVTRAFGWKEVGRQMADLYRWVAGRGQRPDFVHN